MPGQSEGFGDFNRDGRSDILWCNPSTGQTTDWLAYANGSFLGNDADAFSTIGTSWQVQPPPDLWASAKEHQPVDGKAKFRVNQLRLMGGSS